MSKPRSPPRCRNSDGHALAAGLRKVNPADQSDSVMSLNSDVLSLPQVDEYAETLIASAFDGGGVSQVQVYGAMKYAVARPT